MRSLWRRLALRWLGGEGSEALTGDTALLDTLFSGTGGPDTEMIYRVTREPGVSHRAMMPAGGDGRVAAGALRDRVLRGE